MTTNIDTADYCLPRWDSLSTDQKHEHARLLAARLPSSLQLEGIERQEAFGHVHEIAFFRYRDGRRFALVPGGEVHLGYDPERSPLALTEDDRISYEGSMSGFALPPIEDYLAETLAPPLRVTLLPFLIDIEPLRIGDIEETVEEEKSAEDEDEDDEDDEDDDDDETEWLERSRPGIERYLGDRGMRLPTPDEWEHAMSGGTTSVFPWGNDIRRVTSAMCRTPNAFGIIAMSGYPELTSGEMRGGDGGTLYCGGVGRVPETLVYSPRRIVSRRELGIRGSGDVVENSIVDLMVRRVVALP